MSDTIAQHCLEHARRLQEHERRIDRHDSRIDSLHSALYGERGSVGIVARLAKVEEVIIEQRKTRLWLIGMVIATAANVATVLTQWLLR